MDIVYIRNLRLETIIGIHDWEKQIPRPVIFQLELASDVARAAATDQIADALDYEAITQRLRHAVSTHHFDLIESLAEHCAGILRDEFGVRWLRLSLSKPGAVGDAVDVGVVIERGG